MSSRTPFRLPPVTLLLGLTSLGLLVTPVALGWIGAFEGPEHANEGAYEGGETGTAADAGRDNAIQEDDQRSGGGFDLPTGGFPSPLFGARSFEQPLLRFEEFGSAPLPHVYHPGASFPVPNAIDEGPAPEELDAFLAQDLYPAPTRLANERDTNPWQPLVEELLGRDLVHPPAEGRPPGEGWAHQRWDEFLPQVWFTSAMAGSRVNSGLRDERQLHAYAAGEFAPGGLYHNTTGAPGFEGTTAGIAIRFHPRMPVQAPNALWTFDGTLPPKLLMARHGVSVLFRHYNALPVSPSANFGFGLHTISTHEHNGHTPAESDGYTNAFFFPGQYYDYRWPLEFAGHDSVNLDASDPRVGFPDGNGGVVRVPGDWRETESTHWFHDHMLDFTASNVYKGNAAMMNYYSAIDRGNEGLDDGANLRLPSGTALDWGNRDYDVNLVIADKAWTRDGQLWFNIFNLDGFMGDRLLTNWLYDPYLEVRARRYRFRILNGSVSRYLKIALVDQNGVPVPFHMIANDGNIMEHAVAFDGTLGTRRGILPVQAIAERYDIVVDFSSFQPGDRIYLVNLLEHKDGRRPEESIPLNEVLSGDYRARARDDDDDGFPDRWRDGDPCVGKFLELRVREYDGVDLSMDPAEYVRGGKTMVENPRPTEEELATAIRRTFEFGRSSGTDESPWTIKTDGGAGFAMDPRRLSAAPNLGDDRAGTLEIWRFENGGGGWSHPIHAHFEEGVILSKDGEAPPEWELWARKDVYRIGNEEDAADEIEIAIRFREFAGTFMEHCHNTQHEDHAMLMRWDIEKPGQVALLPAPIPSWDGVEFVESEGLPTFRTGDGVGPTDGDPGAPATDDGDDDDGSANESITVLRAQHDVSEGFWRVQGATTVALHDSTMTVHAGPDLDGPVIGVASVLADGRFRLEVSGSGVAADATRTISLVSSNGGWLLARAVQTRD